MFSISESVYRRLFVSFCLSGCLMLFLIYTMSLTNSILLEKDIIGQLFALAIIVGLPVVMALSVNINNLSVNRIAIGSLVLFLIDVVAMIVFLVQFNVSNFSMYNMSDFYTIVFIFVSTLTMLVAKIFVK